ncbi:MAG TPA: DUF5060 domain-containing protein, partial [Pirellulales bacterium]|nr:DUF5060 domain-containing protein [Pirellulales bacterium]
MVAVCVASIVLAVGAVASSAAIDGCQRVWHPITLTFAGPAAAETDTAPNPFLDFRLQVTFTGPANQRCVVPGFFDGDGNGGSQGRAWRVHFTPDAPGTWQYQASFRQGADVAIQLEPLAGEPLEVPGSAGSLAVEPLDPQAPGFLRWGRLGYVGQHYLKFQDGPYWLRGGTDEPEDFLGYAGFDRTPAKHRYAVHETDWRAGDPDWGGGRGRAIIGALNYLAGQHVNSIYFLTMNVGGDGKDVWPWVGPIDPKGSAADDNLHFDTNKL